MKTAIPHRCVSFEIIDSHLTMIVEGSDGRSYVHRCSPAAYQTIAHALGEVPIQGKGTSSQELARAEGVPFSQTNVATEFMKERGVAVTRLRRLYPSSKCAFEDAMTEWHWLEYDSSGGKIVAPQIATGLETQQ